MNETISTRSLWCSAYLVLKGYKLITFELITPHNGHFIFECSESVRKAVTDFYTKDPQVRVRDYLQKYNALRDLVMHTKREANINQGRIAR